MTDYDTRFNILAGLSGVALTLLPGYAIGLAADSMFMAALFPAVMAGWALYDSMKEIDKRSGMRARYDLQRDKRRELEEERDLFKWMLEQVSDPLTTRIEIVDGEAVLRPDVQQESQTGGEQ